MCTYSTFFVVTVNGKFVFNMLCFLIVIEKQFLFGGLAFLGREDLLEKGTTTHSSILAWRIP